MNLSKKKFYVTTPIYYVTAKPHLGSLYSTLLADVLARWHRLKGDVVFFLTGTDEHGQKIAQAAEKAHKNPKEFVDSFIDVYKKVWHDYELAYTYFIRTTDENHKKAVQAWLQKLMQKGDIYKARYQGWYCIPDETFLTEKPDEKIDVGQKGPLCPTCSRETVYLSEESYFFKLSAYQDRLLQFYANHPDFIIPRERAHEVINFVKEGLRDLSISRTSITWGIPFPGDDKHVTYVWADALNNYITAIGYAQKGKEKEFETWWPADVQILGKDIIRFHAIYWPAFLMASDLPVPKQLLVHGWIKVQEQKMSKSLGNVVDPEQLLAAYGAEPVRYYLVRHMSITQDTNFAIEDLEQRITADLANDLGNLLNRMAALAEKHQITSLQTPATWSADVATLRESFGVMVHDVKNHMHEFMFHLALASIWKYIAQTNAYFHSHEPWKLAKSDEQKFKEVLAATCHSLYGIAVVLIPVMPKSMESLLASLGITLELGTKNYIQELDTTFEKKSFSLTKIPTLFAKPETKKSESAMQQEHIKDVINEIDIEHFSKIELRVGTIEACEPIPKSDKLYRLQVNFGPEGTRQVLSGIKQSFTQEQLIGKQGVFVFNLKPRAMMGLESHGMLLTAIDDKGALQLVGIGHPVPNGTRLK